MAKIASDAERKNRGGKKRTEDFLWRYSLFKCKENAIPPYISLRKIDLHANEVQVVNTCD